MTKEVDRGSSKKESELTALKGLGPFGNMTGIIPTARAMIPAATHTGSGIYTTVLGAQKARG